MQRLIATFLYLLIFFIFTHSVNGAPPGSDLLLCDLLKSCGFSITQVKGDPFKDKGMWVFGKKKGDHSCTVLGMANNNHLYLVTIMAKKYCLEELISCPLLMGYISLAAPLAFDQGEKPSPTDLEKQFYSFWSRTKTNLVKGGIHSIYTGHYGLKVQTVAVGDDWIIQIGRNLPPVMRTY